jgi:hypothetical protein
MKNGVVKDCFFKNRMQLEVTGVRGKRGESGEEERCKRQR